MAKSLPWSIMEHWGHQFASYPAQNYQEKVLMGNADGQALSGGYSEVTDEAKSMVGDENVTAVKTDGA